MANVGDNRRSDNAYPTFEAWLAVNPAPSLTALIETYQSYNAIPPEAWVAYDTAMKDWKLRLRHRHWG